MTRVPPLGPNRPYARLKDCAGQVFVGGSLHGEHMAILVFEKAWCWVSLREDPEEGYRMSEHQWSLDSWVAQEAAVKFGLLTREQVDQHREAGRAVNEAAKEAHERAEYERLKKKFEAQP